MTLSEEFCQGVVCGILIGLFILLLYAVTSRERIDQQQTVKKRHRGPGKNDDTFSRKSEFEVRVTGHCS